MLSEEMILFYDNNWHNFYIFPLKSAEETENTENEYSNLLKVTFPAKMKTTLD